MPAIDNFRQHINALIRDKKTSILEIHRLTGISRNLLYGYFEGGKEIDISRAEAIAGAVRIDLNALLGAAPPTVTTRDASQEELRYQAIRLIMDSPAPVTGERLEAIQAVLNADPHELETIRDTLIGLGLVGKEHGKKASKKQA